MARKSKDSNAEARAYALKLLGYRSRSKKEMIGKLRRKGFDDAQVSSTIKYLSDIGLMDDESLASDLYRYSAEYKSLGKNGIRQFLMKRGISKDLIDKTLLEHNAETEEKTAFGLAERRLKLLKNYPEDVIKRRLWGMLQRRGFSYDLIKRVVNSIC